MRGRPLRRWCIVAGKVLAFPLVTVMVVLALAFAAFAAVIFVPGLMAMRWDEWEVE